MNVPTPSAPMAHSTEAELRAILEQSCIGIGRARLCDGIWLDANLALCKVLGRGYEDLLTLSIWDVMNLDEAQSGARVFRQLVDNEISTCASETRFTHLDGHDIWTRMSLSLIRGADGEPLCVAVIIEDISARKCVNFEQVESAAQLEAERLRLQAIVDTIPTGLIMLSEAGELLIENEEWIRTWGGNARTDGVIDYEKYKGFYPDTGAPLPAGEWPCALSLKKGIKTRDVILDIERFNGTRGTIVVSSAPVRDASGRVVAAVAANMDITELRLAERKLLAEDKRKTEFIATLAHELRNPLAPIRSGLSVLALSGDSPQAVAKVRVMMERQVTHLVRLIDDLLDVARISGDKLALQKAPADLRSAIANAVENNTGLIQSKQQTLRVELPEQILEADVDSTRVVQIVGNLLNNSSKYTPLGGVIELTLSSEEDDAVITVSDSGIGIAADELAKVFDMFSQVGSTNGRLRDGLGIGLSLVRRLVEMHGGTVEARSVGVNAGSLFIVRLPLGAKKLESAAYETKNQTDNPQGEGTRLKVLIVDDNVDAAATLAMILELRDHEVRMAHDGIDALACIEQFTPQLVLLDIGMPRMDGYETVRAMRERSELNDTCVVALTGWGTKEDVDRSKAVGFDFHLTKPVNMEDLERFLEMIQK